MARGLLRLNLVMAMAILLVMTTESRDFMATMAMARGLLSQAMAMLPVISTVVWRVSMAIMDMDMARGLLLLAMAMAKLMCMKTASMVLMVTMDTERGLLNLAMVDIMAKLMFMKIVSM